MNLKLPVTCDCGHTFQIDPVGVGEGTDLVCPKCQKVDHLDLATLDRIKDEFSEVMGNIYDDEDEYQSAVSLLYDAPERGRAKVVDDGF
jgi:hypothetical protein